MTTEEYRMDMNAQGHSLSGKPADCGPQCWLSQNIAERVAPIAEALLKLIEDDRLPDRIFEPFSTALLILAETVEDVELGLIGAPPEQAWQKRTKTTAGEPLSPKAFDPALFTPYVQAIYAREVAAVQSAAFHDHRAVLQGAAYRLGRVIAAGALPTGHVRESLMLAAGDLPACEASALINAAFQEGFRTPRRLPAERGRR